MASKYIRFLSAEEASALPAGQAVMVAVAVDGDGAPVDLAGGAAAIGDGSVTEAKLADGAVTEDKIGASAVTGNKIAEGAVSAGKLEAGGVDTLQLADGAVTEAKIEDGAVTASKIAAGVVPEAYVLPAATAGALGGVKMAAHVASAAGDTVTQAEFEALLDALEASGVLAPA